MSRDVFDIAVVGAGPAGAVAAYVAARRGLNVALIDRRTFPRDKVCGDGIGPAAVRTALQLGLGEVFEGYSPVTAVTVFGPNGTRSDSAIPDIDGAPATGYVIPRVEFDYRLFQHALDAGTEDFTGLRFLGMTASSAFRTLNLRGTTGELRSIQARLVVGADGAYSAVRKNLITRPDPDRSRHVGFALRAYADIDEPQDSPNFRKHLILEFSRDLLPSYGWVFPAGANRVNIGVGGPLDVLQKRNTKLSPLLETYAESIRERGLAVGELREQRAHHLPHIAGMPQLSHDRAVLIGDAASMINPVSGEGIAYGVTAAAQLIESLPLRLEDATSLNAALTAFEREFRARYRTHFVSSRMTLRLLRNPLSARMLVRSMQRDPRVLADAVDMLFGFGRFRTPTAWRVIAPRHNHSAP